jgi:phosphoribosylformimino-5-aminoimidazole carboxamide ribotide isomerase
LIAYAAVDLMGGRVVQLVGGLPAQQRISLPDPAAVARHWVQCGFRALHVVDLDAALGSGDNSGAIHDVVVAAGAVPVQAGGGVRSTARAEALLDAGVARVVVGTRAVEDQAWLERLAERWPQRIVVAADVRGDDVVVRGWTASAGIRADVFLQALAKLPLAAVLVTDVTREGQMVGVDSARFAALAAATAHPLLASGGVAGPQDLADLAEAGAAGAVLGMALYTGALDPHQVALEYAS